MYFGAVKKRSEITLQLLVSGDALLPPDPSVSLSSTFQQQRSSSETALSLAGSKGTFPFCKHSLAKLAH